MIQRQEKEENLRAECSSVVEFVANRLEWNNQMKHDAIKRFPALSKCSILKVNR